MSLPVSVEYGPMEADSAQEIPEGAEWTYEPKWDGFRCLAYRDGADVDLRSKAGQPLGRYFPEVVDALQKLPADTFVLDGELIVPLGPTLSFDSLLQRIHPAASRIRRLAEETPAQFVIFDMLVDPQGRLMTAENLTTRRRALQDFTKDYLSGNFTMHLSPTTGDIKEAKRWFKELAGGLDGIVAKRTDVPYQSGNRAGMLKIKNLRTADCVIGGFRYAQKAKKVGSLLLGLYDEEGLLHHVGYTSGLAAAEKQELTDKLEKLIEKPGFTGSAPGGPSRWSTDRSTQWEPLKPTLVVEVQYDHFTGGRFRHGTKLLRWRPDKAPLQCKISQVERETLSPLHLLDS